MDCTFSSVSSSTGSLGSQILGNQYKYDRKCQQFISTYADLGLANVCTQRGGRGSIAEEHREGQQADLLIKGDHILATEPLTLPMTYDRLSLSNSSISLHYWLYFWTPLWRVIIYLYCVYKAAAWMTLSILNWGHQKITGHWLGGY